MNDARGATAVRGRRTKIALLAGVVLVASCLVALLLAEFVVRIAAPQQLIQIRPDLWQPVDSVGWVRRPNANLRINTGERTVSIRTDADGYRIGAAGRRDAPTRVLLIGDSFIEALQVEHEQSVAHLLEQRLGDSLRRPVVVRNAGINGWNPNHYLIRTRQLLARERFALVVIAVFVGNDAVPYRFERIAPRAPVQRRRFRLPRSASWSEIVDALFAPMNDALEVRSHLYILAKNQLSTMRMRLGMTADYLPLEYRREQATSPRWHNTAAIARDIRTVARGSRTPVLFVLIPERFQVYPDDFHRYLRGFGIDSTTVDVEQPSRLLNDAFRAESLVVIDALASMRAAASATPERFYGRVDQHLSPAGHRALANVLVPEALRLLKR
jgi:hypothetical protein